MYELTLDLTEASQYQRYHVSVTPLEAEVRTPQNDTLVGSLGPPSPPKGVSLLPLGVVAVGEAFLLRRKAGVRSRAGRPDDRAAMLSASQIVRSAFVSRRQIVGLSPHRRCPRGSSSSSSPLVTRMAFLALSLGGFPFEFASSLVISVRLVGRDSRISRFSQRFRSRFLPFRD